MATLIKVGKIGRWFLLLPLLVSVPACGNKKISRENFDKIKVENPGKGDGMTLEEVETILGRGTKENQTDGGGLATQVGVHIPGAKSIGGGDSYIWESGDKLIRVYFRNGKAVNKMQNGL
jgi:hypothetical protein